VDKTRIGDLRWLLWQVTRQQIADIRSTGITETLTHTKPVHGKVEVVRPGVFYAAEQTDSPTPTHMITIRWSDYLDNTHAFIRQTRRPTDGEMRTEVFRVRRLSEDDGRKRFMRIECEMEADGWSTTSAAIPSITPPVLSPSGVPLDPDGPPQ